MGGGGYDGGAFLSGVLGRNETMSDLSMMARIAGGVIVAVNLVCVVAPAPAGWDAAPPPAPAAQPSVLPPGMPPVQICPPIPFVAVCFPVN